MEQGRGRGKDKRRSRDRRGRSTPFCWDPSYRRELTNAGVVVEGPGGVWDGHAGLNGPERGDRT